MTFVTLPLCLAWLAASVAAQSSSYPQNYSGIPSGGYSTAWQSYFQVTTPLPNVTFSLERSFAGNIGVSRAGHPNNTLFFWGFEQSNGSLTAAAGQDSTKPWAIWLNGGPGASSMIGLAFENGPIHINNDYSISSSKTSWSQISDYFWIDQPVGTGYATADANGFAVDEDQVAEDFVGFLTNLVKVFPSLATRPLYLTGESYAGTYIPYIAKALFSMSQPPVQLAKLAIGDGTIGSAEVFELLPIVTVLETYPQIIGYDTQVLAYFKEQSHLCGYDLNFTYPQQGKFPTLGFVGGNAGYTSAPPLAARGARKATMSTKRGLMTEVSRRYHGSALKRRSRGDRKRALATWKRSLAGRANGTIDGYYGCDLLDEMVDYATNFSFPWTLGQGSDGIGAWDIYNIPDATYPEAPMDASVFLNDPRTRSAIHAPLTTWVASASYPFGGDFVDPSVEPMAFADALAANATTKGVKIVIYSGNDDALVTHRGSEVVIQNTTFGGIQGFTRPPSTPWYDDSGNFAGIVHQERGLSYVLINKAGHEVGYTNPSSAYVFAREFVFGSNSTGLVSGNTVIGGESMPLINDVLPGQSEIFYGSGATQSSTASPSATVASWNAAIVSSSSPANAAKTTSKHHS